MSKRTAGFGLVLLLAASVACAGERQTLLQQVRYHAGKAVESLGKEIASWAATMRKGMGAVTRDVPKAVSDSLTAGRKGIASAQAAVATTWQQAVKETHSALTTVVREVTPTVGTVRPKTPEGAPTPVTSPILDPLFLRSHDILLAWHARTSGRSILRSLVLDDRLLLEDTGRELFSFNPRGGIIQWVYPLPGQSQGIYRHDATTLFVIAQDTLYEIDRTVGLPRSRLVFAFPVSSAPTIQDKLVVVASVDRRVYAINRETRVREWSFVPTEVAESAPAVAPNALYVADVGGKLTGYSVGERRILWTYKTNDAIRVPLLMQDDDLFFASEDFYVHNVNRFGGFRAWKFPVKGLVKQPPWVEGDRVYFAAEGDALYAVAREKGDLLWSCPGAAWPVAVGKECIYVQGAGQELWCLDRATGAKRWSVSAKPFTYFVRNTESDHFYLCGDQGDVYAFYLRGDHIEKKIAPPPEKAPLKKPPAAGPEAEAGEPTVKPPPKLGPPRPAPTAPKAPAPKPEPKEGIEEEKPAPEPKAAPDVKAGPEKAPEKAPDKGVWKSKAPEGEKAPGELDEEETKQKGPAAKGATKGEAKKEEEEK